MLRPPSEIIITKCNPTDRQTLPIKLRLVLVVRSNLQFCVWFVQVLSLTWLPQQKLLFNCWGQVGNKSLSSTTVYLLQYCQLYKKVENQNVIYITVKCDFYNVYVNRPISFCAAMCSQIVKCQQLQSLLKSTFIQPCLES